MDQQQANISQPLVKGIGFGKRFLKFPFLPLPVLAIFLIVTAGVLTGYFLSGRSGGGETIKTKLTGGIEKIEGPKEAGIKDTKAFRDTAQGKIEANDQKVVKEGSHKLLRPGGPSQTAYLTSSVIDLNLFASKCVQVWGETFSAQSAGWLMDVGHIKVLDTCPEGI